MAQKRSVAAAINREHQRNAQSSDDAEAFLGRESTIIHVGKDGKPKADARGRRSLEDMMAGMSNELTQSAYALERIQAFEDQIAKVLSLCSPEALQLVLEKRPFLRRYAPESE